MDCEGAEATLRRPRARCHGCAGASLADRAAPERRRRDCRASSSVGWRRLTSSSVIASETRRASRFDAELAADPRPAPHRSRAPGRRVSRRRRRTGCVGDAVTARSRLMPPTKRPFPRFIADASQEGRPYGRWEERLREEFAQRLRAARRRGGLGARPDDREVVSRPLLGRARLRPGQRARGRGDDRRGRRGGARRVLRLGLVRRQATTAASPPICARRPTSPTSPPRTTPTGRSTSTTT